MTIKAHSRTLTLWTGPLLTLLIVAAFVVSGWLLVGFQVPMSRGPALYLTAGSSGYHDRYEGRRAHTEWILSTLRLSHRSGSMP